MTTYTAPLDGVAGVTVTTGQPQLGGLTLGGGGTGVYVTAPSGFDNATVARFTAVGARKNLSQTFATWSEVWVLVPFRSATGPVGDIGTLILAEVGATQVGRAWLSQANAFLKIDGSTAQTTPQDASTHVFAGGNKYSLWAHLNRAAGTFRCVVASSTYYEVLEGLCGATTGTLTVTVGIASTVTHEIELGDDVVISTTAIAEPAIPLLVTDPQGGNPRTDGFDIVVETSDVVTHVRAKVSLDGNTEFTTTGQAAEAINWSKIECDGLAQWTDYDWQVQVSINGGADYTDAGQPGKCRTLLPADYSEDVEIRLAVVACEEDNRGGDTRSWDHAIDVYQAHGILTMGDQEYSNYQGLLIQKWRDLTSQKLQACPGMARAYRLIARWRRQRSDHDGGDGNGGFAQAAIEFAMAALEQTTAQFPTTVITGGPMKTKGQVTSKIIAGFQLIWLDARTMYRDNPTDTDGAGKYAYHPDQEAWFIDLIEDFAVAEPTGINVVFTEWPWVGEAADQGVVGVDDEIKWDHMARYKTQRTRMDAVIAAHPVLLIGNDYHGGAAVTDTSKHPIGHQHLVGGGTTNDSGNVRLPDLHNYDFTFAGAADTDDGVPINLYTQVTLRIVGGVRSVVAHMVDASIGKTVLSAGIPPVEFSEEVTYSGITISDVPMHLPGTETQELRPGVEIGKIPAKVVQGMAIRGLDGVSESDDVNSSPVKYNLPLRVYGTSRDDTERNVAGWMALFGRQKLRPLKWAPTTDTSPEWEALVRQDDEVVERWVNDFICELDFTPYNPDGRWRTPTESTWKVTLDDDDLPMQIVTTLSRARAPMDDGILRLGGPFNRFTATDGRSLSTFHWGMGDDEPFPHVPAGSFLIVYLKTWKAWIVDHDTWDETEDGRPVHGGLEPGGIGGAALTLTPDIVGTDLSTYSTRLEITFNGAVAGITTVELKVRAATYRPVL